MRSRRLDRRSFVKATLQAPLLVGAASASLRSQQRMATDFQLACMTLVYSAYPLQRALEGIAASGFRHVVWGTTHMEKPDLRVPLLDIDAPASRAVELARTCRDLGLAPVMMFSGTSIEAEDAVENHRKRIAQAEAAGIPQILTMGRTQKGGYRTIVDNLRALGPEARRSGVLIVLKQHGGETDTGKSTARIIRDVDDEGIRVNYDAGNVLDYLNVDPLPDVLTCADLVRSFCIKDHRNFPSDQDCGPGFGEIDHYRLLAPFAFTGRAMPLAFENIWLPLVPRPENPEGIDALARRAREYVQAVVAGLQL